MCNKGGLLLGEMDGFGRRRFHLQIHEKNRHHSRTFLRASSSRFAKISHNQDVQFYDFFPQFASLFPQQKWPFSKEIAAKMRSKREIKNPGMPYTVRLSGVSCGYSHSANSNIWGCISVDFTGNTFANMLISHLLFGASRFLSARIVLRKATIARAPGFASPRRNRPQMEADFGY